MPTDVPVDPGQYLMTSAGDWREEAACGRHDPELFFPIGTTGPALEQVGQARRICRLCPVQASCLGWALKRGVAFSRPRAGDHPPGPVLPRTAH